MSDAGLPSLGGLPAAEARRAEQLCTDFEAAWRAWPAGPRPRLEDYLEGVQGPVPAALLCELLQLELAYRRRAGEAPALEDYRPLFADDEGVPRRVFRRAGLPEGGAEAMRPERAGAVGPHDTVPDVRGLPAGSETALPHMPGYEVIEELGRGSMGVVYRAHDRKRGQQVALKTLQSLDPASLYRFKQEFRALADLAHPNLVTLHELVSDGPTWFFTMDLVEGVDFLRHVYAGVGQDAPPQTALSLEQLDRLRSSLRQLAEAVTTLHAAGKLHRDIKPTNMLVRRDGCVVLLDFGLAADLDRAGLYRSTEEHIVGTVAYMAPEQSDGRPVSPASDWYSVGVILYQALTAQLPFRGGIIQVLLDKQRLDPPAPRDLLPGVPEDLNALCVALLSRRPEERPPGQEILRRLEAAPPESAPPAPYAPTPAASFVGRERQLEALAEAFQATRSGRTVVVHVCGRSGQGKTALAQRFLDGLAGQDEAVVLTGRCYEQESVPYKALDSLIDALSRYLRRLPRPEAQAVLPRDVGALTRLFPVLSRVAAVAEAPRQASEAPDQQELRRRGFAALRELFGRLGDRRPLVLFIDDLQWGDLDSATLLSELLRPPDLPVFLLLECFRSEDEATSPCLAALRGVFEPLGSACDVRRLTVEALTAPEVRDLVQALLGPDADATPPQVDAVVRESGGNPFFVHELVEHLRSGPDLASVPFAAGEVSLEEVLQSRIGRLPEEARCLLEVVAVAGRRLEKAVACRAAGVEARDQSALHLLRTGHLVRSTRLGEQDEVEPFHDRIGETVRARLPKAALRAYHGRLAAVMEAQGDSDPEILALHLQGAGDQEKAGRYYAKAAERAAASLAFDHSAKLYRLALDLSPPEEADVGELRTQLGDALANAGRGAEAAGEYLTAAEGAIGPKTLELWRRAAYQYCISGHIAKGREVLELVLAQLGMRLPRNRWGALVSVLLGRVHLWLRGLHYRERGADQLTPEEQARIDVSWTAAVGLTMIDTIRGADFQTRNLLLALQAGEPYRLARALAWQATHVATAGEASKPRVARLLCVAEELVARVHDRAARSHVWGLLTLASGIAAYFQGHWQEALQFCDRAETLFRESCTGVVWEHGTASSFALWSLFFRGEVVELSARLPGLLQEARARTDLLAEANVVNFGGTLSQLAADDPGAARQALHDVMVKWPEREFHTQHFTSLAGHTYIDLYCRQGAAAWERLAAQWPRLSGSKLLHIQAVRIFMLHLRARSALAAAESASSPALLLRAAARDARRIEREKTRWSGPMALLIRATILVRRGERSEAAALFALAGAGFEAAGMKLFAAAARHRQGELLGGGEGEAVVAAADAWMVEQAIRNPAAMTALHVPGFEN